MLARDEWELLIEKIWHNLLVQANKDSKWIVVHILDKQAWANSVDPDEIAPKGAFWSWSTRFAILSHIRQSQGSQMDIQNLGLVW